MSNALRYRYRRSYIGPPQAAILDWAGTAIDYGSRAPAGVFVEVFRQQGVDITIAEAREPMGMYKLDHIRAITQMPRVAAAWQAACSRPVADADVQAMFDDFIPRQMQCLADHADVIPGCLEAVDAMRRRDMKIGSSTGYNAEMMQIVTAEAAKNGYQPDAVVCASDVPAGRPAPWMCLENMKRLDVYPPSACVKIDDTVPGIIAGLNCGMWTVGVTQTGNGLGLSADETSKLRKDELATKLEPARLAMSQAGSHFVIDGIGDIGPVLDEIEHRLRRGEQP